MNNSAGFTLVELIVTIVLVGILVGSAIPTFSNVINTTQKQVNISNMETIKNTFMQYFYENHMTGDPHFPPEPENDMMDSTYKETQLQDGRTLNNLFVRPVYLIIVMEILIVIIKRMIQVLQDL